MYNSYILPIPQSSQNTYIYFYLILNAFQFLNVNQYKGKIKTIPAQDQFLYTQFIINRFSHFNLNHI